MRADIEIFGTNFVFRSLLFYSEFRLTSRTLTPVNSLIIAGHFMIPEVCLLFNAKLFRGNRTTKISAEDFDAFGSPNCPPLATITSTRTRIRWDLIHRPTSMNACSIQTGLNTTHVACLRIFPGIKPEMVDAVLKLEGLKGLVLETFGAGNTPGNADSALNRILIDAVRRGIVIVNVTQCVSGSANAIYEAGTALARAGIVFGNDMTSESALTKLSYLLSLQNSTAEEVTRNMSLSLRGEMSDAPQTVRKVRNLICTAHMRLLLVKFQFEMPLWWHFVWERLETKGREMSFRILCIYISSLLVIYLPLCSCEHRLTPVPPLKLFQHPGGSGTLTPERSTLSALFYAIREGDLEGVREIVRTESRFLLNDSDYSGNTPLVSRVFHNHKHDLRYHQQKAARDPIQGLRKLARLKITFLFTPQSCSNCSTQHIASTSPNVAILKEFLVHGASVHIRNREGHTPLFVAANAGLKEHVGALKEAGAHLHPDEMAAARLQATTGGDTDSAWAQAGTDLLS